MIKPPCSFMSSGLMLDDIIMNLFTDSTKQTTESYQNIFTQYPGWYNSLVQSISVVVYTENKNADTKKKLWSHHYIEGKKWRKYMSVILSIDNYETDLGKKKIRSLMILATLITKISFIATTKLYPIYLNNHVTYHPWHQLDSGMVKMN